MTVFFALLPLFLVIVIVCLAICWIDVFSKNDESNLTTFNENIIFSYGGNSRTKVKYFVHIAVMFLLTFGVFYGLSLISGEPDRRPRYLQLIDTTVDETISEQLELIEKRIELIGSNKLPIDKVQQELPKLSIDLHVLEVLIRETADDRQKLQENLNAREVALNLRAEEVDFLDSLSESEMVKLKRILLSETQRWSYLSLFLGIFVSIPLFWISEAVRGKWIAPFFSRKKKSLKLKAGNSKTILDQKSPETIDSKLKRLTSSKLEKS